MPLTDDGLWFDAAQDPPRRQLPRRQRPHRTTDMWEVGVADLPVDRLQAPDCPPHRHPPVKRVQRTERHSHAPVFELGDFDDTYSGIWAQAIPHRHRLPPRLRGVTQDFLADETASTFIVMGWWAQEQPRDRLPLAVRRRDVERIGLDDLPPIDAPHTTAYLTQQQPPHRLLPRGRVTTDQPEDTFEILGVPIWAAIQQQDQRRHGLPAGPSSRDVFGWPFQTDGEESAYGWRDAETRPPSRTTLRRGRAVNDARSPNDFASLAVGPFYVVAGQVCPAGGAVVGEVRAAGED